MVERKYRTVGVVWMKPHPDNSANSISDSAYVVMEAERANKLEAEQKKYGRAVHTLAEYGVVPKSSPFANTVPLSVGYGPEDRLENLTRRLTITWKVMATGTEGEYHRLTSKYTTVWLEIATADMLEAEQARTGKPLQPLSTYGVSEDEFPYAARVHATSVIFAPKGQ
jgi:hypothetical protein